ncbi:MAG: hypothetical protein A3K03_08950 [Bdellovibrionales bacterium RIFOXYD1_FULL_44_7]|nr:MAG: hypothetical protein A3K03_08950 [Bdellovibrionales bacterium RIFOXYD1_FULL_44_7]
MTTSRKAFSGLPKRWRLIDQPLGVQFLVAGGIVAFFSVVSITLLLTQVKRQAEASRWLSETHRTVGLLNTLGKDFYQQQTAFQEYVRTTQTRHYATVLERRQLWDEDLKVIYEYVRDEPKDRLFLDRIKESYKNWITHCDIFIGTINRAKEKGVKAPSFQSRLIKHEGALFKEGFLLIDQMIDLQNNQLKIHDAREKGQIKTTFSAIAFINVALLLIFGVALAKLYISIARPISDLSKGISKYQNGDFKARVAISNRSQIGFLEATFNEMAEKIEAMVADLRKLDELKTEFLSTVSHELRTPLTSIGGYAKLLVCGDAGPVTDTQKEFLDIIDTNVVRLTHLINDILDVEKMESGKVQLQRERQNLTTILRECRDTFDVLARQKGLELKYSVPSEDLEVIGDHDRLVQTFMNLLSNAIKYTKSGNVELVAEKMDYAVTIRVRDTGVGLTAEEQENLFQKFYRAKSGLSSGEGGTGLGLVIVRGLVEAHGGSIKVESESGKGTCFTITFPIAPRADARLEKAIIEGTPLVCSIWIVDGRTDDAKQMADFIKEAASRLRGYELTTRIFSNVDQMPGPDSVDPPDMVIVDPDIQGGEYLIIPEIRQKLQRTLPILVVGASIDAKAAFAEGASAWLRKPINQEVFLAAVRDLISRKNWKILVADSNTDLRLLLKRALEQRGFKVDDVDRGSVVLSRLEQENYDLALIDMTLPDISSLELLKIIREVPRFHDLAVFLMSVNDKNRPSNEDLAIWGEVQFMPKYRGLRIIVDSICEYLEDRRLVKNNERRIGNKRDTAG